MPIFDGNKADLECVQLGSFQVTGADASVLFGGSNSADETLPDVWYESSPHAGNLTQAEIYVQDAAPTAEVYDILVNGASAGQITVPAGPGPRHAEYAGAAIVLAAGDRVSFGIDTEDPTSPGQCPQMYGLKLEFNS